MTFRSTLRARALAAAFSVLFALLAQRPALAAIETLDASARVVVPAPSFAFSGASNTVLLWLRRSPAPGVQSILDIPGALALRTTSTGDLIATLTNPNATPPTIELEISNRLPENEWALVSVSVNHASGIARLTLETASRGFFASSQDAGDTWSFGPVTGQLTLGATGALPAMPGAYGILVVRDHAIAIPDAEQLFDRREHFGPYDYDNTSSNGSMNGANGALWMINHALFSQPFNGSNTPWTSLELAAEPDQPARRSDFVVFNRSSFFETTSLRVVRNVTAVDSMIYRSPFDIDPGFFLRARPTITNPLPPNPVAGVSATLRAFAQLAPPTSGMPLTVVASANSRGVRTQDALGNTGTYAQGFTFAMFPVVSGIVLRPAFAGDVGPYFALRTSSGANNTVRRSLDTLILDVTNLSRFWTGSLRPAAPGPGTGVLITNPGSFYALRAQGEPGSLLTEDRRLLVRAYMLAYPGSAPAQILADVGPTQNAPGTQTPIATVELDTSIPSRASTINAVGTPTEFLINGNLVDGPEPVTPGMATVIASGITRGDIAVITELEYIPNLNVTRVAVSHPFLELPLPNTPLLFGEFRYEVVEHIHGPVQGADDWRGLEIRNAGELTDLPIALFAFDAMNPDDGGYAIGPAGAAGRGYGPQINDMVPGAFDKMARAIDADIWIQLIAHQNAAPDTMTEYTNLLRAARPSTEFLWLGCVEYEGTIHENWQRYILENARAQNVVGMTVLDHPIIGSYPDFAADGGLINGGHVTSRGNTSIALAALDYLRSAARWPGDANNDATVDFADLNALLSNFGAGGPNDGSLLGDVNLDGVVDFADLNAVLSNFGTSVDD